MSYEQPTSPPLRSLFTIWRVDHFRSSPILALRLLPYLRNSSRRAIHFSPKQIMIRSPISINTLVKRGSRPLLRLIIAVLILSVVSAQETPRGIVTNEAEAFQGYTLYAPLRGNETLLLNMEGRVVHKWTSAHHPSNCAYLLPNGDLLRSSKVMGNEVFGSRGPSGGRVELFDWEGNQLWWSQGCSD